MKMPSVCWVLIHTGFLAFSWINFHSSALASPWLYSDLSVVAIASTLLRFGLPQMSTAMPAFGIWHSPSIPGFCLCLNSSMFILIRVYVISIPNKIERKWNNVFSAYWFLRTAMNAKEQSAAMTAATDNGNNQENQSKAERGFLQATTLVPGLQQTALWAILHFWI